MREATCKTCGETVAVTAAAAHKLVCRGLKPASPPTPAPGCEMCGDNEAPLYLHAKCHMTAPLQAILHGDGTLELRCYVPSCRRTVVKYKITEIVK